MQITMHGERFHHKEPSNGGRLEEGFNLSAAAQPADSSAASSASRETAISIHQDVPYTAAFLDRCTFPSDNAEIFTIPDCPIVDRGERVAWPTVGTSSQQFPLDHSYQYQISNPYHRTQPSIPAQHALNELPHFQVQPATLMTDDGDPLGQTTFHHFGDDLNDITLAHSNQNGQPFAFDHSSYYAIDPSLNPSFDPHQSSQYPFTRLPELSTEYLPSAFDPLSGSLQSNLYDWNHGVSIANPSPQMTSFW